MDQTGWSFQDYLDTPPELTHSLYYSIIERQKRDVQTQYEIARWQLAVLLSNYFSKDLKLTDIAHFYWDGEKPLKNVPEHERRYLQRKRELGL